MADSDGRLFQECLCLFRRFIINDLLRLYAHGALLPPHDLKAAGHSYEDLRLASGEEVEFSFFALDIGGL